MGKYRVHLSEENYKVVYHIHFYKENKSNMSGKDKPSNYLWVRVEGNFHF